MAVHERVRATSSAPSADAACPVSTTRFLPVAWAVTQATDWHVTSKALGRDYEEDLSIRPVALPTWLRDGLTRSTS